MFRIKNEETILEVQKRFTYRYGKKDLTNKVKVLKCLNKTRQLKVTTIAKYKELTIIVLVTVFEKLTSLIA